MLSCSGIDRDSNFVPPERSPTPLESNRNIIKVRTDF